MLVTDTMSAASSIQARVLCSRHMSQMGHSRHFHGNYGDSALNILIELNALSP